MILAMCHDDHHHAHMMIIMSLHHDEAEKKCYIFEREETRGF